MQLPLRHTDDHHEGIAFASHPYICALLEWRLKITSHLTLASLILHLANLLLLIY
jgi:hypothetical protein